MQSAGILQCARSRDVPPAVRSSLRGDLTPPVSNPPLNRSLTVVVLLALCVSLGCSTWRAVPTNTVMSGDAESLVGERVKLYTSGRVLEITVRSVEPPYIEGVLSSADSTRIRVHLREVQKIEVYGKSAKVGLLNAGQYALLALIALFFLRSVSR